MIAYHNIIKNVLDYGIEKPNRTKFNTISVTGEMFRHDMREGFPIVTTKAVPYKLVTSELEMFIKGITSKKFLQDRNNHIWDEWCNPKKVPYSKDDPELQAKMAAEDDLGPVYGYQWRHWNKPYGTDSDVKGIDQLKNIIDTIKTNPGDRRMICTAWNPEQLGEQALPPCHNFFTIICQGSNFEFIDLMFNMRSVDVGLGLPFDIASYATLLELIAKETNKIPRMLIGTFADTHIYTNHIEACKELISRVPKTLPKLKFNKFTSIYDFEYTDVDLIGYEKHPPIKMDIAI